MNSRVTSIPIGPRAAEIRDRRFMNFTTDRQPSIAIARLRVAEPPVIVRTTSLFRRSLSNLRRTPATVKSAPVLREGMPQHFRAQFAKTECNFLNQVVMTPCSPE